MFFFFFPCTRQQTPPFNPQTHLYLFNPLLFPFFPPKRIYLQTNIVVLYSSDRHSGGSGGAPQTDAGPRAHQHGSGLLPDRQRGKPNSASGSHYYLMFFSSYIAPHKPGQHLRSLVDVVAR